MSGGFSGSAKDVKQQLADAGIRYGISVGRRAPMHRMHADCIQEIKDAGLEPVVFIGSTNGAASPLYDPLRNPMTVAQQKAQLKLAFPEMDVDGRVFSLEDVGNYERWCDSMAATVARTGMAGKAAAHFRSKSADAKATGNIKALSAYSEGLISRGLSVWESRNRDKGDDDINASALRTLNLEALTPEQKALLSAPDYIIHIAKEARAKNPARAALAGVPVTMLDLTFDRLRNEAGIDTQTIIEAAKAKGALTVDNLTAATQDAINTLHQQQPAPAQKGVKMKMASASLNQTVQNFTRNVPNILAAIDKAVEDKADVLSLQELVLTGYTGDDNFKWIRSDAQQKELVELLHYIADYAKERDPNLVLSVGFPFFYADKKEPVKLNLGTEEKPVLVDNPLYNINNKPFNAVATISDGKIHAISAKSIQPEGAAEYEPRQFQSWPDYLGVKDVTLFDGQKVPLGKVIVQLGKDNGKSATVYHEICAEAWPGIADDGTVNKKEQDAVAITQMIDINIQQLEKHLGSKEKAVEAFIDQFEGMLRYGEKVKEVTREKGAQAGVDYLKSQMLTCAYFPSENSSFDTENAARTLIEGGTLPDGTKVKGIGGTFHIMPVQEIVDSYLEVYSGVDKKGLTPEQKDRLSTEIKEFIKGERDEISPEFKEAIKRRVPSWKNKGDDLTLQNIQARARLPVAWLFGNDENKIACVTSNWSEAVAGYWTFGGDGHMGSINVLGGVPKSDVRKALKYLETKGLDGLEAIPALHFINQNKASAELRPLSKDGKIKQFDEDDMMPYEALDCIARKIIIGKNSPVDAYKQIWLEQPKFASGQPIFDSKERLIADIEQCCWRWHSSQFKRVAAVITPFLGENVDPHTAVRTTIMSDGFMTGRAALKMEYLKDKLGGEKAFEEATGKSFGKTLIDLKISAPLRKAVLAAPLDKLEEAVKEQRQAAASKLFVVGG